MESCMKAMKQSRTSARDLLLVLIALSGMLMPSSLWADPTALTDDKSVSVPTAYWTYTNLSVATI